MKSLWTEGYEQTRFPELSGNTETNTLIIGGGLAGVLCAYMLRERGIDCLLLEAKRIGSGTTHNTTAKITAQHGLIYSKIEKSYGLKAAKEYLGANLDALKVFRSLSGQIDCDFEEKTAYVYSLNDRKKLDEEAEIYKKIGAEPIMHENPAIPLKTVGALGLPGQAQLHPMKFLSAISKDLPIYENTFVRKVEPGKAITDNGCVRAKNIVLATHYPMVNLRGFYFVKLYQRRSYVIALSGAGEPDGMYIDEKEDGLSFRSYKDYLLLGGGGHRTGGKGGGWAELRKTAKAAYPNSREEYFWAAQDCMSLDSVPYIGRQRRNNRELFVASGFNKWGMTGSMASAIVLSEMISEGKNRYANLFNPSRSVLHPQLFSNIGHAALGLVSFGKRCTHMGCALKWNPREKTWDCPCHGSRFSKDGQVIDNPAKKDKSIE